MATAIIVNGAADMSPADEPRPERLGPRLRAPGHRDGKVLAALGSERHGEQERLRRRADGGEIREVDGRRPSPEPLRVLALEEVHVLDQEIRRRREQARRPVDRVAASSPGPQRTDPPEEEARAAVRPRGPRPSRARGRSCGRAAPAVGSGDRDSRADGSGTIAEGFPPSLPTSASGAMSAMSRTSCIDST